MKRYTDRKRFSIVTRVSFARQQGMKWKDAHKIAREAGFRGGLPALMIFMRKKPRSKKNTVVKAAPVSLSIADAIEKLVSDKVNVALAAAIAKLQGGISSGG